MIAVLQALLLVASDHGIGNVDVDVDVCPQKYLTSLNDSNCIALMTRAKLKDNGASPTQCERFCCANSQVCSSWLFHNSGGGQCWVSPKGVDPSQCHNVNPGPKGVQFIGQSTFVPPPPPPVTKKQGFTGFLGPNFTCNDAAALALNDSWFYTWTMNSAQGKPCPGAAAEFVPMIIGLNEVKSVNAHYEKEWKDAHARFLLGYNEPDYGNGHNHPHMCAPAAAAKDWVDVQALAERLGLSLVSPAMSTTGLNDQGESKWMDEFLGNCSQVPGCNASKIDYFAFHDYNGHPNETIARAEGMMRRYGKPVWITEFAIQKWARIKNGVCNDCNITRAMEDDYMEQVLPMLEQSEAVYRYAWFTARDQPIADVNPGSLLEYNVVEPTLTSTGTIYKTHALGNK